MNNLIAFVILFLVSSCYHDEYVDLTFHDDYFAELTIFFENETAKDIEYSVTKYETNGFNQFVSYSDFGFFLERNTSESYTRYLIFKEYKKIGLEIIPQTEGLKRFKLVMREMDVEFPYSIPVIDIERDLDEGVSVFYDFETKKLEVR